MTVLGGVFPPVSYALAAVLGQAIPMAVIPMAVILLTLVFSDFLPSSPLLVYLRTCFPVYLFTCVPVSLSTNLPVYLSTCFPLHQSPNLPIFQSPKALPQTWRIHPFVQNISTG